jgi:drug/metabolite transporter (DMT)-like permease
VIVSTQPFFVAAMEAIFWKDKISRKTMVGMILALGGMVIISGSDFQMGGDYLWGDLLALIGAFCAACYLMVGRRLRQTLANRYYILPVYAVAAATLLVITVPTGAPLTGFSTSTWIYFALLALVPTMMGHSLYNYLLKFIRPHLVGITILGEPIGATVFAALLFKEYPPPTTYLGGAMILGGILLALSKITSEVKSGKTA